MMSLHSELTMTVRASVVEDIPETVSQTFYFCDMPVFRDLMLAYPEYSPRCRVDILLRRWSSAWEVFALRNEGIF